MVGNSKVLTVSYGAFSCTLEGFDDSFDTMKAIAECFRDLAADDRYFGAEPPQPDAEVLARIAAEKMARGKMVPSIQAEASEGNVHLKPAAQQDAPPAAEEVASEEAELVETALEEPTAAIALEMEGDTDAEEAVFEEVAQEPVEETTAGLKTGPGDPPQIDDFSALAFGKAKDAEPDVAKNEPPAKHMDAVEVEDEDIVPGEHEYNEGVEIASEAPLAEANPLAAAEAKAEQVESEAAVAEEVEDVVGAAPERDTSLAEKLRRIQAVVASAPAETQEFEADNAYLEDEHAETFVPVLGVDAQDAPVKEDPAPLLLDEPVVEVAADTHQEPPAAEDDEEEDEMIFIFAEDASGADEVVFEEAVDDLAENLMASDPEEVGPSLAESTLTAEDEADLAANLAAVEEVAPEVEEVSEDQAQEDDAEDVQETVHTAKAAFDDSDETMARLMEKTASKLDEPDNRNRRAAYSQLKAAVAATEAARSMGEDRVRTESEREGDYRADLARVVRPRRAEARKTDAPRTQRPNPAPLKLVASQRVDLSHFSDEAPAEATEAPAQPVRPRRVAADAQRAPASMNPAFARFAAQASAEELLDILEAAAAFLTHVEGFSTFSRPQVMRTVQSAMPASSFSREDGLRAFGTLLRQGKINKIRGGQFEVTQSTRFQPEARDMAAAG